MLDFIKSLIEQVFPHCYCIFAKLHEKQNATDFKKPDFKPIFEIWSSFFVEAVIKWQIDFVMV